MADLIAEHIALAGSDGEGPGPAPAARGEKKKRRRRREGRAAAVAARLEAALFGGAEEASGLGEEAGRAAAVDADAPRAGAEEDAPEEAPVEEEAEEEEEEAEQQAAEEQEPAAKRRRAAWDDADDEEVAVNVAAAPRLRKLRRNEEETVISGAEYQRRLRETFVRLHGEAAWADLDEAGRRAAAGEDATAALFRGSGALGAARSTRLARDHLEVTRLKDANELDRSQAVVQAVEFHPAGQVMLAAGLDKTVRLFQVDGVRNPKVQSVHLRDMPVMCAHFSAGGRQIVAAGRRRYFYSLDVETGRASRVPGIRGRHEKSFERFVVSPESAGLLAFEGRDGAIPLVSQRTLQTVGTLKMNGTVRASAFSGDGLTMRSVGGDGQVYLWDLRMRRCLDRFTDDGCVNGTALALSGDGRFMACGSESGVVNLYDAPAGAGSPTLRRSIMSLTTKVDTVRFNHDAQVLAIASRTKRDALRLVHLPSGTVFSNFPTARTPLRYVSALDFSPSSGFVAMGNDRGRVLLYRLHHYGGA